jgi:hypothetical protein
VYTPHLELESFNLLPLEGRVELLTHWLEALCFTDCEYLRAFPDTPLLYEAGIRYREDAPGTDTWRDIPRTLVVRFDDCVGLSSWRVAELRMRLGEPGAGFDLSAYETPRACSTNRAAPCRIDYHVRVRRADGRIEDPSYALGMKL